MSTNCQFSTEMFYAKIGFFSWLYPVVSLSLTFLIQKMHKIKNVEIGFLNKIPRNYEAFVTTSHPVVFTANTIPIVQILQRNFTENILYAI